MVSLSCAVCGAHGDVVPGPPREITVGTVAATVERRPVVACPAAHSASPPQLAGRAMDAVGVAIARARSRLLRSDRCDGCREVLAMPVRRTTRTVSVESPDIPVVTIHLDVPMTRCGACGLDQVPSRSHEDLTVVVPALFAPETVSGPQAPPGR